jgi:hypothetical protein
MVKPDLVVGEAVSRRWFRPFNKNDINLDKSRLFVSRMQDFF